MSNDIRHAIAQYLMWNRIYNVPTNHLYGLLLRFK